MEEMDYLTWLSTEHKEKMEEKWDNVKEFFKYFDECLAKGMSLHDILEKSTLSSPKDEEEKGVRIMSMHSSKGLEFNNVFICCCEDGVIPHRRSIEDDAGGIDEERRLFYVAMTRAEDRLVLTFSIFDSKMKKSPKKPSRFLFESQLVDTDDLQEQFQRIMS
jgi:DNA helicase-2/ATP-dependent DNA helicase PcrA